MQILIFLSAMLTLSLGRLWSCALKNKTRCPSQIVFLLYIIIYVIMHRDMYRIVAPVLRYVSYREKMYHCSPSLVAIAPRSRFLPIAGASGEPCLLHFNLVPTYSSFQKSLGACNTVYYEFCCIKHLLLRKKQLLASDIQQYMTSFLIQEVKKKQQFPSFVELFLRNIL